MALEKVTLGKSITNGLRKAMEKDPKVVLIGEDIGKLGGVFRVTDGLQKVWRPPGAAPRPPSAPRWTRR